MVFLVSLCLRSLRFNFFFLVCPCKVLVYFYLIRLVPIGNDFSFFHFSILMYFNINVCYLSKNINVCMFLVKISVDFGSTCSIGGILSLLSVFAFEGRKSLFSFVPFLF